MTEVQKVSLLNIGSGAAIELFDRELTLALENIADINTEAEKPRKIILEVAITPTEDRALGFVDIKCSAKLLGAKAHEARVEFVQEGRKQVAYQRIEKQGVLPFVEAGK